MPTVFYQRQFLNRKELSNDLLERFNRHLASYFESGQLQENGIPSIEKIADMLSVSKRYLSDTLKKETGKNFNGTFAIVFDRRSQEHAS